MGQSQKVYHVRKNGPLASIQSAAQLAQPGDTIIVHSGIYRERIDPPTGGLSEEKRITYMAAPGEQVEIRGSGIIKGWKWQRGQVWMVTLPNSFFGGFNPYNDEIRGDWYDGKGWKQHTGAVYLDGNWLMESSSPDSLISSNGHWYARVTKDSTCIMANFGSRNPNKATVEINVRQSVFYPSKTGIDYITVSGFTMKHAATPWAAPTAEQIGLIGTNWSKGWIIENCDISYSKCSGISLGKYGDAYDNTSANSAEGYVETVQRALLHGWDGRHIGHHLVRNNHISFCEQAGIVGSLGCSFSAVTGNTIHDVHMQRLFGGAEMAAIKFHGAVDMLISNNLLYHNNRGIWLDWMAQGTRITNNVLFDHDDWDTYFEVNHGPILLDNNIMLSRNSQRIWSQGIAYVHNMVGGRFELRADARQTPVLEPHSTNVLRLQDNPAGDLRFYDNLFFGIDCNSTVFDQAGLPVTAAGNRYCYGARPSKWENHPEFYQPDSVCQGVIRYINGQMKLDFPFPDGGAHFPAVPVHPEQLGITVISRQDFVAAESGQTVNARPLKNLKWQTARTLAPPPRNWHLMDPASTGYYGVSLEKAETLMASCRKISRPVIVAVIDSGIDTANEALSGQLWTNTKEVPGNGIDDDGNGYPDDIHGWNFLGGRDGSNVGQDSREFERIYFERKDALPGTTREKAAADWRAARSKLADPAPYKDALQKIRKADSIIKPRLLKQAYTLQELDSFNTASRDFTDARNYLAAILKGNRYPPDGVVGDFINGFDNYTSGLKAQYEAFSHPPPNYRGDVTKDNEAELTDQNYGNPDVQALTSYHGTHVAGIIAGIAPSARLMILRVVPDGDEHDKDIALAIRYAVDNGAKIINMSFGKGLSPHKDWIDDAVGYAERKHVLLVHAAGNENIDIDTAWSFPTPYYFNGRRAANWISVGAGLAGDDPTQIKAWFSNFGKKTVDVFAPGVSIWSTVPGNKYEPQNGTSMAAPVVSGMAAFLLSYYPGLSATRLRNIIEHSVIQPKVADLGQFCRTGGIVNLFRALKLLSK